MYMNSWDFDPPLKGLHLPTKEQWVKLFEDCEIYGAKEVQLNNPKINYNTLCKRIRKWKAGREDLATMPLVPWNGTKKVPNPTSINGATSIQTLDRSFNQSLNHRVDHQPESNVVPLKPLHPPVTGLIMPTAEQWMQLFKDIPVYGAKQVHRNNPDIAYRTLLSRFRVWQAGRMDQAIMPLKLSHNSKRLSVSNTTSTAKRQRLDEESTSDDDEPANSFRQINSSQPTNEQSRESSNQSNDSQSNPASQQCEHPVDLNRNQSDIQLTNQEANQTIKHVGLEGGGSLTNQVTDMLVTAPCHAALNCQSSYSPELSINQSTDQSIALSIKILHPGGHHDHNDLNDNRWVMNQNDNKQYIDHSPSSTAKPSVMQTSVTNNQTKEQQYSSDCDKKRHSSSLTTLSINQKEYKPDCKIQKVQARADRVRQLILESDDSELQSIILAAIDQWEQGKIKNVTDQTYDADVM